MPPATCSASPPTPRPRGTGARCRSAPLQVERPKLSAGEVEAFKLYVTGLSHQ